MSAAVEAEALSATSAHPASNFLIMTSTLFRDAADDTAVDNANA
jgi:hypothetical protein